MTLNPILVRAGQRWKSTWDHHVGRHLSRGGAVGSGPEVLADAARVLKLGFARLACREFLTAERQSIGRAKVELAKMGRVRALRLSGQLKNSEVLARSLEAQDSLSPSVRKALTWEGYCRQVQAKKNLAPMLDAIKPGGGHYDGIFVFEGYLWAMGQADASWREQALRTCRLKNLSNRRVRDLGFLVPAARQIERCYDDSIPYAQRLEELGELLSKIKFIVSAEKELLLWACAARWLEQNHAYALAAMCLDEYRTISLRLSAGRHGDVLHLVEDLLESSWMQSA